MKRVLNLLRESSAYRRDSFNRGLAVHGFKAREFTDPTADDLLLIWNRYGQSDALAKQFEAVGAMVLVVENGYLGRNFLDDVWYAISIGHHNGAGRWPKGPAKRWDSLGVKLAPWRKNGSETVIMAQRGIGEPGVGMPNGWVQSVARETGARVRQHPGIYECIPLEEDLAHAESVITWGSGGALKALVMGIPVQYDFPQWIGARAASRIGEPLFRGDRLAMFRRLAHAMWRLGEIEDGTAFERILQCA